MTLSPGNIAASIDPVKLDRLAEVAIKVGLQLQPGQDLLLTAPVSALPLVAPYRRTCLQGRRRAGDADLLRRGDDACALSVRRRTRASTAPPGWLYEGMAKAFDGEHRAARHRRRQSDAAVGQDPAKVARANRANSHRLPAGAGEDRRLRHQLEHRRLSRPGLGASRCSRTMTRRCRRGQARRRDLRRLARRRRRPDRRLGRAQRRAARAAPTG